MHDQGNTQVIMTIWRGPGKFAADYLLRVEVLGRLQVE